MVIIILEEVPKQQDGFAVETLLDPGYLSTTNHYDGTVFSTAPNMGTARQYGGSNGIQSGAT